MIDLKIGNHRLRHDGIQWTVTTTTIRQKGEKAGTSYDADPSYFPRLSQALQDVWERKVGESEARDLRDLLETVHTHAREIREAAADADRQLLASRQVEV
jgi:hypothetical protein